MVPSCDQSFPFNLEFFGFVVLKQIQGNAADHREVLRSIAGSFL